MHCPRCKRLQPILDFKAYMVIDEFAEETANVYSCKLCRWTFAPIDRVQALPNDEARLLELVPVEAG